MTPTGPMEDELIRCRRCSKRTALALVRWVPPYGNVCLGCSTAIEDDEAPPPNPAA